MHGLLREDGIDPQIISNCLEWKKVYRFHDPVHFLKNITNNLWVTCDYYFFLTRVTYLEKKLGFLEQIWAEKFFMIFMMQRDVFKLIFKSLQSSFQQLQPSRLSCHGYFCWKNPRRFEEIFFLFKTWCSRFGSYVSGMVIYFKFKGRFSSRKSIGNTAVLG